MWMAATVEQQSVSDSEPIILESLLAVPAPLVLAPADWKFRGFVEEYADHYLSALQRGSKRDFLRLHLESEDTANARDASRLAFGHHQGFKAIRKMQSAPQMAILREASEAGPNAEIVDDGLGNLAANYSCTICFCLRGDCSATWPTSTLETDNHEGRPYVCTDFGPFKVYRDGWVPAFRTWRYRSGLHEPLSESP